MDDSLKKTLSEMESAKPVDSNMKMAGSFDDADFLTVQRLVPKKKGKWWVVPKNYDEKSEQEDSK